MLATSFGTSRSIACRSWGSARTGGWRVPPSTRSRTAKELHTPSSSRCCAVDVIEHVRRPDTLLQQMAQLLTPSGELLVSTPNFAHWYPRFRVATGTFGYDRRGILDETHLRFFTAKTLRTLFTSHGLDITELRHTGLPFDVLSRGDTQLARVARRVDHALVRARPP